VMLRNDGIPLYNFGCVVALPLDIGLAHAGVLLVETLLTGKHLDGDDAPTGSLILLQRLDGVTVAVPAVGIAQLRVEDGELVGFLALEPRPPRPGPNG